MILKCTGLDRMAASCLGKGQFYSYVIIVTSAHGRLASMTMTTMNGLALALLAWYHNNARLRGLTRGPCQFLDLVDGS